MIFLHKDDFQIQIDERISELILDDYSLEQIEKSAIQIAKSRLARKFDVYKIFKQKAESRDTELVSHLVSICLYKAWMREAPAHITQHTIDNYNEAKEFLERVSLSDDDPDALFTDLPLKEVANEPQNVKFIGSSNNKYNSRF